MCIKIMVILYKINDGKRCEEEKGGFLFSLLSYLFSGKVAREDLEKKEE